MTSRSRIIAILRSMSQDTFTSNQAIVHVYKIGVNFSKIGNLSYPLLQKYPISKMKEKLITDK